MPVEVFYDLFGDIEQLQQENEELKEQIKLFKKDLAKVENICQKYHSRYCDIKLILTEFEKWLEKEKKQYHCMICEDKIFKPNIEYEIVKEIYGKLQELKGEVMSNGFMDKNSR